MKARIFITASALATALVAASATASISTGNLGNDVQSALGSEGNVNVTLVDGVATLTGYTDGLSTKRRVHEAAQTNPDVERVIDLVLY